MTAHDFDTTVFNTTRGAGISECGLYRYWLTRAWVRAGEIPKLLTFCMLNPSTANADVDDPTIRRCMGYARREGCNSLRVVNLYAYRSTAPKAVWEQPDPVGPDNEEALTLALTLPGAVICAWGKHARPLEVDRFRHLVAHLDRPVVCLGTNLDGSPKHPLYLRADSPLIPWK